jgi:hypothetical protein
MFRLGLIISAAFVLMQADFARSQHAPKVVLGEPEPSQTSVPAGKSDADMRHFPKVQLGLAVTSHVQGQVSAPARLPCESECGWSCGPPGRLWVSAEYLMWWTNGSRMPALLSGSPDGTPQAQAGVLGAPGTSVLFGNSVLNHGIRSGFRVKAGAWLDDERTCGVEANFFMLGNQSRTFQAGSADGSTIVSRPYFNAATNQPDAELVSFPGVLGGTATVSSRSSGLLGAGALLRENLCCGTFDSCGNLDPCDRSGAMYRIDALFGYRYYGYDEQLGIIERLQPLGGQFIPGTQITVNDQFQTHNTFNGVVLGLAGEWYSNRWSFTAQPRFAFGQNFRQTTINGSTVVTTPGFDPVVSQGGLLALPSNIGTYRSVDWVLIPELDLGIGYRVTQRLRCTLGYSMIYWSRIARANSQVDSVVNGNLIPSAGGTTGGPQRPAYTGNVDGLWMHGLTFGVEYRY